MVMCATVLDVLEDRLLVLDEQSQQEVEVITKCRNFAKGEAVKIFHSGIMTMSLPPQISSKRVIRRRCPQ